MIKIFLLKKLNLLIQIDIRENQTRNFKKEYTPKSQANTIKSIQVG
jgi:hypothetical protein